MAPRSDLLVYIAGGIIAASAVPQIWDLLVHPDHASAQSVARTALLLSGNVIFASFGYQTRATPILITSGIGAALNAILLCTIIGAKIVLLPETIVVAVCFGQFSCYFFSLF
jgi:hypothetical protein